MNSASVTSPSPVSSMSMNVECRMSSMVWKTPCVEKFLQRLRGEPEVKRKSENRAARYEREHAQSVALSGPTGEVWNEQLRYSTVNSKGEEYPRNKKILYWARILRWRIKRRCPNLHLRSCMRKRTRNPNACVLLRVAGSYSNKDRRPIPLSEVDRFI